MAPAGHLCIHYHIHLSRDGTVRKYYKMDCISAHIFFHNLPFHKLTNNDDTGSQDNIPRRDRFVSDRIYSCLGNGANNSVYKTHLSNLKGDKRKRRKKIHVNIYDKIMEAIK